MAPTLFWGSPEKLQTALGGSILPPAEACSFGHMVELSPAVVVEVDRPGRQAEELRAPSPPCVPQTPHLEHGFRIDKHVNKERQDH